MIEIICKEKRRKGGITLYNTTQVDEKSEELD